MLHRGRAGRIAVMPDLIDDMCDDESAITGHCENCDWLAAGRGLAEIRQVIRDGNAHMSECRHSVKLDLAA